eukprot:m51a1_g1344 hypothetical protein (162) ;mRNA; r:328660-329228
MTATPTPEAAKLAGHLNKLTQVDVDAFYCYALAVDLAAGVPDLVTNLAAFRDDHLRHAQQLSAFVGALGFAPIAFTLDYKAHALAAQGAVMSGMTISKAMTLEGMMKAMRSNEAVTNNEYKHAQGIATPVPPARMLADFYADEQRHLAYIESYIRDNKWEE